MVNHVCCPCNIRTLAYLTVGVLEKVCEQIVLLLFVFLLGEVLDEVVLEDLCCHFQKMWFLGPPDFP